MSIDQVHDHFNTEAFEYDGLISKLIPKYHEQNQIIFKLIPFSTESRLRVLDLGCGTGILSYIVLSEFPKAEVVAFDLAENMLMACRDNLSKYSQRLAVKQGNFDTDDFGTGYDLVLSGLATHHLSDNHKSKLYKRIYQSLNPGGVFLNREVILGATPRISETYHRLWREFMRANGEDDQKWFSTYLAEDIPARVEDQLQWLSNSGFKDVGCHWQYLNFAIFGGSKQE